MGCYSSKQKFAQCTTQSELQDMMKNEKVHFKNEYNALKKREDDALASIKDLGNESKTKEHLKEMEEIEKNKPYRKALHEFIKGLDDFEADMNVRVYSDTPTLSAKIQGYFDLAEDKNQTEERIRTEYEAIKQWLRDHVKTS